MRAWPILLAIALSAMNSYAQTETPRERKSVRIETNCFDHGGFIEATYRGQWLAEIEIWGSNSYYSLEMGFRVRSPNSRGDLRTKRTYVHPQSYYGLRTQTDYGRIDLFFPLEREDDRWIIRGPAAVDTEQLAIFDLNFMNAIYDFIVGVDPNSPPTQFNCD